MPQGEPQLTLQKLLARHWKYVAVYSVLLAWKQMQFYM